jgi:DNA-binding CsgD family transcriptional regulator
MTHPRRHSTKEKMNTTRTQVKVTKLRAEGLTQIEVAAELGIHRNTVGKLEKKSMQELISTDQINRAEYQKRIVAKLESILDEIELHRKSGKPLSLAAIDRQIHASLALAKLTGASAPSRAVVGHVSANLLTDRDMAIRKAVHGLDDEQFQTVVEFAKGISRVKPPMTDAEFMEVLNKHQPQPLASPEGEVNDET